MPRPEISMSREAVIEIENLTKDYSVGFIKKKAVRALDHLTLEVYRGEIFGFLGPNGAGKTTTLKLLMGLIWPSEGTAKILGRPIQDVSVRSRIGYLPENPYFYDYLSGRELLEYTAALFGIGPRQAKSRIEELIHLVGLEEAADRQLRKYSKGMLQRIGIAQALINDPEVVFMDEPMSGLDPIGRRQIRDLLLKLRQDGKTVFFSSHILSDVEALCDRVGILNRGRLVSCCSLGELAASNQQIEVIAICDVSKLFELEPNPDGLVSINPIPGGARIILSGERAIEDAIALIRGCGGRLVSVNPSRPSLEDIFFSQSPKDAHI
jgi:ABC-2 type transport system ATP-binding protein